MGGNASSKKRKSSIPDGYELGRDADGNVILVPTSRDTAPARSPFSRISEGAMEGYGYQPLGMSEKDIAEYPNASKYLNPVAKAIDAVRRAPGAIAGGLAGTAGAGAELWTGDRGAANEAERAVRSALEYGGNKAMAEPGMRPSRNIPRNGELLPPERGAPGQLGYTERPPIDVYRELPPGSIRGTSAEGAPRLTRVDPLTQYRLAGEQGQRIGPNRPPEALRPEVDMMYSPTGRNEFAPNVTTQSRVARLGDEGPLQADRLGEAQAAARARQAHSEFLDELRAAGEGMPERGYRSPTAPPDVPPSRPMSVPEVADAPRSPFLDMPVPGVRGRPPAPAPEPLQLGSSGSASGALVDPLTGHAYQPRQFGPLSQSGSGSFSPVTRAEASFPSRPPAAPMDPVAAAQKAVIDATAKRVALEREGANATQLRQAAIDEAAARVAAERVAADQTPMLPSSYRPGWGGNMATMGGIGAGTAALIAGSQDAQRRTEPVDRVPEGYRPQSVEDFQRMLFGEPPVKRQIPAADADSITAGYDAIPAQRRQIPAADADSITAGYDMPAQRAKTTAASVLGGSRAGASAPAAPAESRGFLSSLIGSAGKLYDPNYQKDMTSRQLFEKAQESPDDPAVFFRADKRWKEENPNYGQPQAEKRGGAVEQKPSKEAMLHKSLEIIHHMIRNR